MVKRHVNLTFWSNICMHVAILWVSVLILCILNLGFDYKHHKFRAQVSHFWSHLFQREFLVDYFIKKESHNTKSLFEFACMLPLIWCIFCSVWCTPHPARNKRILNLNNKIRTISSINLNILIHNFILFLL